MRECQGTKKTVKGTGGQESYEYDGPEIVSLTKTAKSEHIQIEHHSLANNDFGRCTLEGIESFIMLTL